jgi:glycosyltransferase involved in cell wall biosynthesis
MKINVLIINHNGGSIYHGPNLRTYYAAKELVKLGHDVTIVSSSYSHKYSILPKTIDIVTKEVIDGINYRWIRCIKYKNIFQRIYSHFEFGFKALLNRNKLASNTDVVIFSGPPPEIFFFAYWIAKAFSAPVLSDIRDLWPRTQIEMNKLQWLNPYIYFLFFCQYAMVKLSDDLISPLPGAGKYLAVIGAHNDTVIIENGFDTNRDNSYHDLDLDVVYAGESVSFSKDKKVKLSEIKNSGKCVIGYSGSFDRDNDVDSLVKASERLSDRGDLLFLFVGDGVKRREILEMAKKIPNILICNRVLAINVPDVLHVMDICFCGLKPKDIYQYGVSLAKSYEYMAAAKPILWMVEACNNPVKVSGGGFLVRPGSLNDLVKQINYASNLDKTTLSELGQKGYSYLLENYSYQVLGKQWEQLILRHR